ncbi:S-adenosylmethionine:tRNA ribosyltransferase-isomerase, partial [Rhizobium leguminosarum]|uniref:S-adenosylmethionine:tRNA ribosyltransferase-isomerase n=1 Tax=Rhizobium leguminosarum TaxID=384 RepID=UPI003F9AEEEF
EKGEAGEVTLLFDLSGPSLDEAIAAVGHIPLPPYIAAKRPEDERDRSDYQTIYAREEGRSKSKRSTHIRALSGKAK